MTRKLKVLGLMLAVFAMSAVAVSAAQAAEAHFRGGTGEGTIHATAEADPNSPLQIFTTDVGPVECEQVHAIYSGAATSAEATFTNVEYSGNCNTAGLESEIKFNGCHYLFHAGTKTASGSEGTADIVGAECGAHPIEVIGASGLCTVKVGPQTGLGPIKYTNVQTSGKKEEITLHAEIAGGISYSYSGLLCGTGSASDGAYEGTATARATDTSSNPVDLTTVST